MSEQSNFIIYNTDDGKVNVALYQQDGDIWLNQNQLAELFATSKQNIGQHINNILLDNELEKNAVVKNYFTTATDGKNYKVTFYNLTMVSAMAKKVIPKPTLAHSNAIRLTGYGKQTTQPIVTARVTIPAIQTGDGYTTIFIHLNQEEQ